MAQSIRVEGEAKAIVGVLSAWRARIGSKTSGHVIMQMISVWACI